ncbi:hypothetical protein L7F22_041403 [Adiantum nelumboides]|nr:hypothetical protein [Adiantum nelumboides]
MARRERRERLEGMKNLGFARKAGQNSRMMVPPKRAVLLNISNKINVSATATVDHAIYSVEFAGTAQNSRSVIHATPSVELRFNSALARLLIGTHGVNISEVKKVSQAEITVEKDATNPKLCIVKITGTALQKEVAIHMFPFCPSVPLSLLLCALVPVRIPGTSFLRCFISMLMVPFQTLNWPHQEAERRYKWPTKYRALALHMRGSDAGGLNPQQVPFARSAALQVLCWK